MAWREVAVEGSGLQPSLDGGRQLEPERRGALRLRFDADRAAMFLDDRLGDRESESGPAVMPAVGAIELLEAVEEAWDVFGGDPRAVVAHLEAYAEWRVDGGDGDGALGG